MNGKALRIISDLEEKSQGEYLFDMNYIASSLQELRGTINDTIKNMILLGGRKFEPLREQFTEIDRKIASILPGNRPVIEDSYTLSFDEIGSEKSNSVGNKNAQLGELRTKLNLPIPDGFAITAWAYNKFMSSANLQRIINERIVSLNPRNFQDLIDVSNEIHSRIMEIQVPQDMAEEIIHSCENLVSRTGECKLALRSSALGEDTQFSFAGRYATFLNIPQSELLEKYKQILASKFTPKAIYYLFTYGLQESELAMSVGCMQMVQSQVSGVLYTKDPVNTFDNAIVINAVYGLGTRILDGIVDPDIFWISRNDASVIDSIIRKKTVKLTVNIESGVVEEPVSDEMQDQPSLNSEQLSKLVQLGLIVEKHYGSPQDIEWAIDNDGEIFLLQTRPLRVLKKRGKAGGFDTNKLEIMRRGGFTVCPGAGSGKIFFAQGPQDLPNVPKDSVLTAKHPFPGIVTVLDRVRALVTEIGSSASHLATIAREFRVPTISNIEHITDIKTGLEVTVDATEGVIYKGEHRELVEARRPEYDMFEDSELFALLRKLLQLISPLNLNYPTAPNFKIEGCRTFHDITRFCHQKAMEEIFHKAKNIGSEKKVHIRLQSEIPLNINIIYLDQELKYYHKKRSIRDTEIASDPMRCFWNGVKKEGWPKTPPADFKRMVSVMTSDMTNKRSTKYSQNSYAILSKDYMIASLRMGYHFTTIEALISDEPSNNYIRMQYKEGGAALDRRIRRIKLIMNLLTKLGFEHHSQGDFLDSVFSYSSRDDICKKLYLLGRITMMTRQLDMALSNDKVAEWYYKEFEKKLGLVSSDERLWND